MRKVLTMVAMAMAAMTVSAENTINLSESENVAPVEYNAIETLDLSKVKHDIEITEVKPLSIYSNHDDQNKSTEFGVYVCPSLYYGANFVTGAPQNVSFTAASAHDLWLNNVIALKARPVNSKLYLTLGYGWKSNYYKMTGESRFDMNADNVVEVKGYKEGALNKSSRLKTFSHTFSLLATLEAGKHTDFRFGPTVSLNTGKSILTKYEDPYGTIYSEKSPNIKVNKVTFDFMASLTYYGVGLYVKYAPQSVFKGDYGPQFSTVTLGLNVGF